MGNCEKLEKKIRKNKNEIFVKIIKQTDFKNATK